MIQSSKLKYIYPIGLFIAFFLDGAINQVFSADLFQFPYSMISNLIIIWMVFTIFFTGQDQIHFLLWALVLGLMFDWYYTGIFGVNLFIYPLVVMAVQGIKPFVRTTFISVLTVTLVALVLSNSLFYAVFTFLRLTNVSVVFFIGYSLLPTIILNLSMVVVLYYPLKQLFRRTRGASSRTLE
ncbi:rod shape-determining protein MreD [Pediococcus argentinicus]|uniref:MreD protein n=1 Tax=Pediococcus argentinicus TaxID=480391 RepID=A0A0R2N5C5_9LACO|nr:rod shape-determining protein MreD [Pediococcus argentinicus]KRO21023.1 mreD protein [Pediococcus argentinicus]NKZ23148.1 rod shape-determining protein MreD [Pediococcus argentinicus]GEP20326.1 rod shape-determining protein MreD [Pediococcus argentinicus]